jgi:hypothetical protein
MGTVKDMLSAVMELGDCIEGLRFRGNGGMVFLRALERREKFIQ